jgi:hypothetical protein
MRKKIARFIEDYYYLALIHIRSVLERLHILHAPTEKDMQKDIDVMVADFNATANYLDEQHKLVFDT